MEDHGYASVSEPPNFLLMDMIKKDVLLSSAVEASITEEDAFFAFDNNDNVGDAWDGLGFSQSDDLEDASLGRGFVEADFGIPFVTIKEEPIEAEDTSVKAGYTLEFIPSAFPMTHNQILSPPLTPDSRRQDNFAGERAEMKISKSKSAHGKWPKRAFLYDKQLKDCADDKERKQVMRAKNTKIYHETVKDKVVAAEAAISFLFQRDPTSARDLRKREPAIYNKLRRLFPSLNM